MIALVAQTGVWGQSTTISVVVKVVNLPVTVRDKNGQIVRDLTKDDFILEEDGRAQIIKYFAQETNLPLTLGLMVDTSLPCKIPGIFDKKAALWRLSVLFSNHVVSISKLHPERLWQMLR